MELCSPVPTTAVADGRVLEAAERSKGRPAGQGSAQKFSSEQGAGSPLVIWSDVAAQKFSLLATFFSIFCRLIK